MSAGAGEIPPASGQRPLPRQTRYNTWRQAWRRMMGPIRVRLALLVFIAAIPVLLLSATIAWQNYRLALDVSAETASRLREQAIARHLSAIDGAEQMMQALAQSGDLLGPDPALCRARLESVLALERSHYSNLAVLAPDGSLRCNAAAVPAGAGAGAFEARNRALIAAVKPGQGFTLGPVRPSTVTGGQVIPALYPVGPSGRIAAYLYAGLRVDWFASRAAPMVPALGAVWIVDPTGALTQVAETGTDALPAPDILRRLLAEPSVIEAVAAGGAPYAYASASLGRGYRLLVADPASEDRLAARQLLSKRIAQLALLVLLGLAAVAIGAHAALIEPLHELGGAVARWRRDGRFDEAAIEHPPTEIRELAASFGEATRALAGHEARHRVAVEQQVLLMKEIHHRVKNNLQIVASLLNLQASRIRQPEAKAEFASARDRVRALATLHRHLYAEGEVTSINMRSFLTELCGQLFQAMGEREGQRIKLGIEASELQMSSDQAVPLSLIVTEAVSNALKYAFPGGRAGHVDVSLTAEGDMAELIVRDDGVGIPAGRAETEMGPRDGIGITLIRGFARQLGAELAVREENGTQYTLRLRLHREQELQEADLLGTH